MKGLFWRTLLAACLIGAASARIATADDASHISPDRLLAAIESGTPPVILDVRSQSEYDSGHVPGAIHVSFYGVLASLDEVPASSGPLVVYCEHGPRAGMAKLQLRAAGYERILYLEGHMSGWKSRGLPVETGPRQEAPVESMGHAKTPGRDGADARP